MAGFGQSRGTRVHVTPFWLNFARKIGWAIPNLPGISFKRTPMLRAPYLSFPRVLAPLFSFLLLIKGSLGFALGKKVSHGPRSESPRRFFLRLRGSATTGVGDRLRESKSACARKPKRNPAVKNFGGRHPRHKGPAIGALGAGSFFG